MNRNGNCNSAHVSQSRSNNICLQIIPKIFSKIHYSRERYIFRGVGSNSVKFCRPSENGFSFSVHPFSDFQTGLVCSKANKKSQTLLFF